MCRCLVAPSSGKKKEAVIPNINKATEDANTNGTEQTPPSRTQRTMGFLENLNQQEIFKRLSSTGSAAEVNVRHSKIAVRNSDEVFFAHGATIRCTKIAQSQTYKLLDTSVIDFEIEGIKSNSAGTLLAIYNEHNIAVCTLPSTGFAKTSDSLIKIKSFKVGHQIYAKTLIQEVQWNEAGRFDSNLVILSSDGHVRAFDLSTSSEVPETAYNLTTSPTHQVGLVTNTISNPVSMAFGSSQTLSGSLTLYVLNNDGDVFSIYPFLPKTLAVSKDSVEDLLNETVLLTNQIVNSSNISLKKQVVGQLRFVKSLWKQIATSSTEIRNTSELSVLKPEVSDQFYIQGPYAMQPYPESLYDDTALTISSIPCGPISLIGITYAENGFVITLPDPRHVMKFQDSEYEDDIDEGDYDDDDDVDFGNHLSLSVLDFKSSTKPVSCKMNTIGTMTILQRGNELFEVKFTKWASPFDEAISTGGIETFLSSNQASIDIVQLKTLNSNEAYEGAFCIENEFGESYKCVTTSQSFDVFQESQSSEKQTPTVEELEVDAISGAKLGAPYFEIEQLVQQVKNVKITPPSNSSTPFTSDENSLRGLNNVSSQVTKQLINFHKLGLALNYRLINQKTELERQIDTTYNLTQRLKSVSETSKDSSEKITSSIERQDTIVKRFQALADKLQNGDDVPLSVSEKNWFKEIQKLAMNFNKSAKQNMILKEQLRYIKFEIDSKSSASSKVSADSGEWDAINQIMKEGRAVLERTTEALDSNLAELDDRMKDTRI